MVRHLCGAEIEIGDCRDLATAGAIAGQSDLRLSSKAGFVHSRLGEHRQAISCYRQALALVRELQHPLARALQVRLLAESGDAYRAAGDLPGADEAWQQALQILRDLGWPDLVGVGARLEQAGPTSPPG